MKDLDSIPIIWEAYILRVMVGVVLKPRERVYQKIIRYIEENKAISETTAMKIVDNLKKTEKIGVSAKMAREILEQLSKPGSPDKQIIHVGCGVYILLDLKKVVEEAKMVLSRGGSPEQAIELLRSLYSEEEVRAIARRFSSEDPFKVLDNLIFSVVEEELCRAGRRRCGSSSFSGILPREVLSEMLTRCRYR